MAITDAFERDPDPWYSVPTGDQRGPARVHGVDVRVVELDGAAGEVVLLHPHLSNAAAPNHARETRAMVTGGVYEAR